MTGHDPDQDREQLVRQKVTEIWREVLATADGEERTTFFELNGDSISAVRIAARIEEELDVLVDVGDIFEEDPSMSDLTESVLRRAVSPAHQ